MGQIRFTDFLNVLMGCLLSCGSGLTLSMQEKKNWCEIPFQTVLKKSQSMTLIETSFRVKHSHFLFTERVGVNSNEHFTVLSNDELN